MMSLQILDNDKLSFSSNEPIRTLCSPTIEFIDDENDENSEINNNENQQFMSTMSSFKEISIDDNCHTKENNNENLKHSSQHILNSKEQYCLNSNPENSQIKSSKIIDKKLSNINTELDTSFNKNDEYSKSESKSTSHHKFSIRRLIRFFKFSKSKNFQNKKFDADADEPKVILRNRKSHQSLPIIKNKDKKNCKKGKEISNTEDIQSSSTSTNEQPNVFTRFVRTFSFFYKRNPNFQSKRRSNSFHNHQLRHGSKSSLETISRKKYQSLTRPQKFPSKYELNSISPISSSSSKNFGKLSSKSSIVHDKPIPKIIPNGNIVSNNLHSPELTSKDIESKIHEPKICHNDEIDHSKFHKENTIELTKSVNQPNEELVGQIIDGNSINKNTHSQQDKYLSNLVSLGFEIPAVCGIQNHGNTCFINSIIQCLSNTNPLAEYFVMDYYKEDLTKDQFSMNHVSTIKPRLKSNGSCAELIENFALLLKSLWSCMYSSDISLKFKRICSKYSSQFTGSEQQDAQEFLFWLLNKIHEELSFGVINKELIPKNQKKIQNDDNFSIIHQLFQGQLHSKTECPNCHYCSEVFDPYMCISLPVPYLKLTLFINTKYLDQSLVIYGISIDATATLRDLRDKISRMIKVPERRLLLLQIDQKNGILEFSDDSVLIQEILEDCATIYALKTPELPEENSLNHTNLTNKMCRQMLTIVWLNRNGSGSIFGPFFTTIVSREINYRCLIEKILSEMMPFMVDSENIELFNLSETINLSLCVNNDEKKYYLSSNVDHPLFVPIVETCLAKTENRQFYRGPYHLKLTVEWEQNIRKTLLVSDDQFEAIVRKNGSFVDKSVELAKEFSKRDNRTKLEDCLDLYFKDENLTVDNAWVCPSCHSPQQCLKKLRISSLPDILVLHLKRYNNKSIYNNNPTIRRNKVQTIVDYPQNGLDLFNYVQHRSELIKNSVNRNCSSANKLSYKANGSNFYETTYNLYAVCCHHGTMQGGHYTAYCKNSVDNSWYLFDDTKVVVMPEFVVTQDAYILFYHKTYVNSEYYEISTLSSIKQNHWSFQMPPFTYFQQNSHSKSETNTHRKSLTKNSDTNHVLEPLISISNNQQNNGFSTFSRKYFKDECYNVHNDYHYNHHSKNSKDDNDYSNFYSNHHHTNTFPRKKTKYFS